MQPNEPEPRHELPSREPQCVDSGELLGETHELVILHKGEAYRLRVTRNDKLILTK